MSVSEMPESQIPVYQKYHDQIFQMLNSRLTETFKFYTPLIIALSGLGYVWLQSVESAPALRASYNDILQGSYLISMFLLFGGTYYVLATSYTYRALQLVLADLERCLQLSSLAPSWNPRVWLFLTNEQWRRQRYWAIVSFRIVPEILKVHLWMFILSSLIISFGYFYYACGSGILTTLTLMVFVLSAFLLNWHFTDKVRQHALKDQKAVRVGPE